MSDVGCGTKCNKLTVGPRVAVKENRLRTPELYAAWRKDR